MADEDTVIVPDAQKKVMLAHVDSMAREAAQRMKSAGSAEDFKRAQDDLAGAQAMAYRVQNWGRTMDRPDDAPKGSQPIKD